MKEPYYDSDRSRFEPFDPHCLTVAATYYAAKGYHAGMIRALCQEYDGFLFDTYRAVDGERAKYYLELDALWRQWSDEAELGTRPGGELCASCGCIVGAGCPESTKEEIESLACILFDGEPTFTAEGDYL